MLEAGIVQLVMADAGVKAICVSGGYAASLPKDFTMPSWWYRRISTRMSYGLRGEHSFAIARLEINSHGSTAASGQQLRLAIDKVLSGYAGVLPDTDQTRVDGCFQSDVMDFEFEESSRSWRFMAEYEIQFFS